jgi:hypothetical protein
MSLDLGFGVWQAMKGRLVRVMGGRVIVEVGIVGIAGVIVGAVWSRKGNLGG